MSYSLLSISDSFWARNGSWAGKSDNLWTSDRIDPHSLLYLWSALELHERSKHTCDNPLYPGYGTFSSPWPLYVTHLVSTEDLISLHHYRKYLSMEKDLHLRSLLSLVVSVRDAWAASLCGVYVQSMYIVCIEYNQYKKWREWNEWTRNYITANLRIIISPLVSSISLYTLYTLTTTPLVPPIQS